MSHKVGGDVDAYCTKCRMVLGHTILAMVGSKIVRVRCNTCQGQHAFKGGAPGTVAKTGAARTTGAGRTSPAPARAAREKAEARPFEELFAGKDESHAKTYSARERFAAKDILSHPTFGLGLVEAARDDKIDVVFRSGQKTLVHGLGGGSKSPVSFTKPARPVMESTEEEAPSGGAADKPPPGESTGLHVVHSAPPTELLQPAEGAAGEEA